MNPDETLLKQAREHARIEGHWHVIGKGQPPESRRRGYKYVEELARLQLELLKLQESVRLEGHRVVVIFEGRDAAGKGGVIKRITECLNPRSCRVVALGTPTERGARAVVLPALRATSPHSGRDRDVRSLVVQPRGRGAGDELLLA